MTKAVAGLALAFALGFGCRLFGIPSPSPPVIVGALLVGAMTVGYVAVDRVMASAAHHAADCGGPIGVAPSRMSTHAGAPAVSFDLASLWPVLRFVALLALCAAYLQGGLVKLFDFDGAIAEARHFGLPFPPLTAAATIVTELVASAMILTGVRRWLGALWLAGFTLIATFIANRFWEIPQPERFMVENAFFEHLGLVGGFLLVALDDLGQQVKRQRVNRGDRP
jgi:XapX domain-containing protein